MRTVWDILKRMYLLPLAGLLSRLRKSKGRFLYARYYKHCKIAEKTIFYQAYRTRIMGGNPYAVFAELVANPAYRDYRHIWVYGEESSLQDDTFRRYSGLPNVRYIQSNTKEFYRALASCQYLICNAALPSYWARKEGQIYVNTWHGTPLKTLGRQAKDRSVSSVRNAQRNFFQCDYLVMSNRYTTERIMEAYDLQGLFPGTVVDVGYPRVDLVLNTDREHILALLEEKCGNSLSGKKIVLYAPTFRSSDGESVDTTGILANYMEEISRMLPDGYELFFKVHNLLAAYFRGNEQIGRRLIFDEIETNELLSVVDVLITDYSSIFFEFLCRKNPILFFVYDRAEYESDRGLYRPIEELPGIVCETTEELEKAFLRIESGEDCCGSRHQRYCEEFASQDDGGASARVTDIIFGGREVPLSSETSQDGREKVLVLAGKISSAETMCQCVRTLRELDPSESNIILQAENIFSFAEDFEAINPEIKMCGFTPSLLDTYLERIFRRLFRRVYGERKYWDRQYHKYFGDLYFDRVINVSGKGGSWEKMLRGRCGEYRQDYPRTEEEIRSLRGETDHRMNVLFVGGYDSCNYEFLNLIRELQRRGYKTQVVAADPEDYTNNKMFIENHIPLTAAACYDLNRLAEVDFAILAAFAPRGICGLKKEILRRKIFTIDFLTLLSTGGLSFFPDLTFAVGTNKFSELADKGMHYNMVATGNPQYDDLIVRRRPSGNPADGSIRRVLIVEQGGYPFGDEGKSLLGQVFLAMANHHPDMEFVVKPRFLPGEQKGEILHRLTEHIYDYIPNPPANLTLLRKPTILEDLLEEFDAMVTLWSTAYLDAALLHIPLMLIRGLPTVDVFDVRIQRVEEAYDLLEQTGCVVDYREVLEGKLKFSYVDEAFLQREVHGFMHPCSPTAADILEALYDQLVIPGMRLHENVQMDAETFLRELPKLRKIRVKSRAFLDRMNFMDYFNRKLHALQNDNRIMAYPLNLEPLQKYWNCYPTKPMGTAGKLLRKARLYLETDSIRKSYFCSDAIRKETDPIRLDMYFDWLFKNGKDKKIQSFSNPNVLPETRDFYLSMSALRKHREREAAQLFASYYHRAKERQVKIVKKDRELMCTHFPPNASFCIPFFEELVKMGESALLQEMQDAFRREGNGKPYLLEHAKILERYIDHQ